MPVVQGTVSPTTLRRLIENAGISQGEAAKRLGVTRQTVVRWLGGKSPISRTAAKLIQATFTT
jgi:transcriptional regulator with XRE-family HTH domain